MSVARPAKDGREDDPSEPAGSARRSIIRESEEARLPRATVLVVAPGRDLDRLCALIDPEIEICTAASPEEASSLLDSRRINFVLGTAEACTEALLSRMALGGLARACAFMAAPGDIGRLVDAYAAQFTFRAISHDVGRDELARVLALSLSPRAADRRSLPGISVDLHVEGGRVLQGALLDLSNRGLAVQVDPRDGLLSTGRAIRLVELGRGDEVLLTGIGATVRYVEVMAAGGLGALAYKLGLEFRRPESRRPESERFVTEPIEVRALLAEGLRRSPLRVTLANTTTSLGSRRATLDADLRTLAVEGTCPTELQVMDVVEGVFELSGSSYSFVAAVTALRAEQSAYTLNLPRALRVVRQRKTIRFRPAPGGHLAVTPISPFSGPLGSRPLINVTATGAAFALRDNDELLPVGTRLSRLVLHLEDGSTLSCRAVVRSRSAHSDSGASICGVEFEGLDGPSRARIADAIARAGQPSVRDGSGTSFEDLFSFFTETNFLYPEKLASLDVPGVTRTLGTLLARPNDLLKTTLVVADGRIQAHASGFQAYTRTWMLQHLAARPAGKTTMTRGRVLNLAVIQYLEQLPGIEWVKIWFRPQNRWPARVFGRFARRLADPSLSSFRTHAYLTSSDFIPAPPGLGVTVRTALDGDLPAIEAHFVSLRDPVLQAADDLTTDDLRLTSVNEAYAAVGLERRRDVLIAERAGRMVGFALAEIASPGLNFSELTNAFRVFPVDAEDTETRLALISAATAHYRKAGRSLAIALAEPAAIPVFAALGFHHAKDYSCWTWHRSQYQAFCEHILRLRA